MTFDAFDVVVVPFPFTDRSTTKRRPALVLSDAKAFKLVGEGILPEPLNEDGLGRALDVGYEFGVTEL